MRRIGLGLLLLASFSTAAARTWFVNPGGTGDAPTIRAAAESTAVGDTILVACGAYYETRIPLEGVTLLSASGSPDCVVIDGSTAPGPILFGNPAPAPFRLEGLTLQNGRTFDCWGYWGGAAP